MATNLQQPFGGVRPGRASAPHYGGQTVRWLIGLAAVALLLVLAALGAGSPGEPTAPSVMQSVPGAAPEQPVFDGRGKWTGY